MNELYLEKDEHYFANVRNDIVKLVPQGSKKILELGCSKGYTLLKIKELVKGCEVVGIDIIDKETTHEKLDNYIRNETDAVNIDYPPGYFDVIICADVLEHLVNPWQAVVALSGYLRPGGIIIASMPNIRYYGIIMKIIVSGDFQYAGGGILDNTHLRFFCKRNMVDLFEGAGLKIDKILFKLPFIKKVLNILTLALFQQFFVKQYVIISRKNESS